MFINKNHLLKNHLNSIFIANIEPNVLQSTISTWENNEEIELFRQYLRIPTVQPNVNYGNKNEEIR